MSNDFLSKTNKKVDLVFAEDPEKLLINIRSQLEKESRDPVSLNIVKEHNSFCALVVSEPKTLFMEWTGF